MTKISVIIPVYNAEASLEDCLEGIRNQTFDDYEVLVVDDGSTDDSGKICDSFAEKDSRFRVTHKPNGGVSSARNAGIDRARGEWICFIDSDDTAGKDYLSHLYRGIGGKRDLLVIQGFRTIPAKGQPFVREFETRLYGASDIYLLFRDWQITKCGFPFAKLYNAQIVRKHRIRFMEQIHYGEDNIFMLTYLCHVDSVQTLAGSNYNYYYGSNPDSLTQRPFSFDSGDAYWRTYLDRIEELKIRFALPQESLLKTYNVISGYLILRSLESMYQSQMRKPRSERIKILKSLTAQQIDFLNTYRKERAWFRKITVFLLSSRHYCLCDWFNDLITIGRKVKKRNRQCSQKNRYPEMP